MKKKYFPNNWRVIKDTPDRYFPGMPYEQFEDWKIYGYVLPSSVFSLVRTKDKDGKVEEFTYNTHLTILKDVYLKALRKIKKSTYALWKECTT